MGRQKKFIDPDAHFFRFLGRLRAAGRSNMYGAIPYLAEEFRVSRDEAYRVVCRWVDEREQSGDATAEPRRSTFRWMSPPASAASAPVARPAAPRAARAAREPRAEQIAMPLTAPAATVVHRPAARAKTRRVVAKPAAAAPKARPVAKQKRSTGATAKPAPKPASKPASRPKAGRQAAAGRPVSGPGAKAAPKPVVKREKVAKAEKRVKASPAKVPVAKAPAVKAPVAREPVAKPGVERAKRAA
jgi:hypothetical protein